MRNGEYRKKLSQNKHCKLTNNNNHNAKMGETYLSLFVKLHEYKMNLFQISFYNEFVS